MPASGAMQSRSNRLTVRRFLLDAQIRTRKDMVMNSKFLTATLLAAAALAGCDKQSHTIVAENPGDKSGPVVAKIDPASLPPAIEASKSYRCDDGSVAYVDWLADKMTANIRASKTGTPTQVKTAEVGKPMTAASASLTGSATSSSVNITLPGKGAQKCDS